MLRAIELWRVGIDLVSPFRTSFGTDTSRDLLYIRAAEALQLECLSSVPLAPCGVTLQPSAWRSDLTGVLGGVPKFWNVRRT